MSRKLLILVAVTAVTHMLIAFSSFLMVQMAAESGLGLFSGLDRFMVFCDVPIYFGYACRAFAGELPYRDFRVEYPPLALPFLFAPRWLSASQPKFVSLFAGEMLVFHAGMIWLVAKDVAKAEGLTALPGRLLWLTAAFVGLAPWVIGRFDAVPTLLGFAAARAWYGGRGKTGGFLAGMGTLIKIFPGAVAIPAFASLLTDKSNRRWGGFLVFLLTTLIGVVSWFAIGGSGVLESIKYHSERGIEIGSFSSGAMAITARWIGAPMSIYDSHSSCNLATPWSAIASRLALPIQAGLMLLVLVRFLQTGGRDPIRFAGAGVLAFAIGGKVLSPQYLLWILPFAATLQGRAGRMGRPLFLIASLGTMVLYPWAYYTLRALETWTLVVLNLRNLALLGLLLVMIRGRQAGPESLA